MCCRLGRTVCSIYTCSATLIYLLFTRSVQTGHPQNLHGSVGRSVADGEVIDAGGVSLKEGAVKKNKRKCETGDKTKLISDQDGR